jgi:hypothetical protein
MHCLLMLCLHFQSALQSIPDNEDESNYDEMPEEQVEKRAERIEKRLGDVKVTYNSSSTWTSCT